MVDLPKIPRRFVTAEEPRSSLSARDIMSPYASLAGAMAEGGEALSSIAEAGAEDAAARAVTVGPGGEVNVERTAIPMVGAAGQRYERFIKIGAVAQADAASDRDLIDLRAQSKGDPQSFMTAAQEYREGRVASLTSTAGPAAGAALRRQIDSRITQTYSGLVNEHQSLALKRANDSVDARILTLGNEAETLARRNGAGPEMQERLASVRTLLDEKVNNPLLAFPKEKADAFYDQLVTKVQGAAIHEQTERVYRERGFEAARTYLRDSVKALDGKVKQLDAIERTGLAFLRAEEAAMRGDRDIVSREWSAMRSQVSDLDPAVLEDIQTRAESVGNSRVALDVAVTRRALETRAVVRSLPIDEQVRALGTGGLVNRIVGAESGGDPNARPPINPATGQRASTAVGTGQFIKDTWRDMIRKYRPELMAGKTDEQILALRTDPALSREMVGKYAEENRAKLADAGVRTDDGALYLAHFLGPGDAIKVLAAPPGTPLAGLVNPASVAANQSVFSRNQTAGQLASWATSKVGGTRSELLARQMIKKDLSSDLTTTLNGMDARVKRGEFPSAEEVDRLGSLTSVVGTPEQRRKAATIAAISEHGTAFQQMSAPQRDAVISAWDQRLKDRSSQGESDLGAALRQADTVIQQAYKADPYGAYYRFGQGEAARPTPAVDFANPQIAGAVLGLRVKQQAIIRDEQGLGPFSVLRPAETEQLRGLLATGDARAAAATFGVLNGLPDDVLAATLKDDRIKAGITSAMHSTDQGKVNAVMSNLDVWYRRDPQSFTAQFGAEAWNNLKTWQAVGRYMTPEQFAEYQRKAQDPGMREIRQKNVNAAEEEARKKKPEEVVAAMAPFFSSTLLGTAPTVPTNGAVRDLMMADYVTLYGQRFADTLNKDTAHTQAVEALGQKWTRSPLNGSEIMLRAPETVYPQVNGDHAWMTPQLEGALAESIGVPRRATVPSLAPGAQGVQVTLGLGPTNWDYRLVADPTTEQEAQRYDRRLPAGDTNRPPSYQVLVRDNRRQTPKWEPVMGDAGQPRRFAFDPDTPRDTARAQFLPTPSGGGGGGGF